jgi:hypothetical protein
LPTAGGEPALFSIALAGLSIPLALFSAYLWQPVPALAESLNSTWLLIHVPVVIVAYGLLSIAVMAAVAYIYLNLKGGSRDTLGRLDRIECLSALAGLALLIIGTIPRGAVGERRLGHVLVMGPQGDLGTDNDHRLHDICRPWPEGDKGGRCSLHVAVRLSVSDLYLRRGIIPDPGAA